MKKIFYILALLISITGCKDSEHLKGTSWKFAGIVYPQTGEIKTLVPENCDDCYTLTFITNDMAEVFLEEYAGYREKIVLKLSLIGEERIMTKKIRPDNGYLFLSFLFSTKSYSVTSSELKLINDIDNYYLLFLKIE